MLFRSQYLLNICQLSVEYLHPSQVFFEGDILYPLVEGVATAATVYVVYLMRGEYQYTYSKVPTSESTGIADGMSSGAPRAPPCRARRTGAPAGPCKCRPAHN